MGATIGARRDEIADLVHDFDSMAGELRNQIQSERNLLSGVSHELRSPIARIRLALALARTCDLPERDEMLDRIEQDTIQLDSMLEQILTVARLESGRTGKTGCTDELNWTLRMTREICTMLRDKP